MARLVKALAVEPDNPSLIPQSPRGGRRKPVPESCPLGSACAPSCTHTQLTHKIKRNRK